MSTNPYQSPKHLSTDNDPRATAIRSVRVVLLIMLVPGILNFIRFNFRIVSNTQHTYYEHQVRNLVGLIILTATIWFFGLRILELITGGIHSLTARKSERTEWQNALYAILTRAPLFAIPGAVLWAIWVWAFYEYNVDFYVISVPVGIAGHALGAGLYIPLIYRWYQLERSTAGTTTP